MSLESVMFRKSAVSRDMATDVVFLEPSEWAELTQLLSRFKSFHPDEQEHKPRPQTEPEERVVFTKRSSNLLFNRYGNAEGQRLGQLIDRALAACSPQGVRDLRFDAGLDHTGDPALFIWVIIDQEHSQPDERFLAKAKELRELIDPIARKVSPDRWPYFRMLSVDDLYSLQHERNQ